MRRFGSTQWFECAAALAARASSVVPQAKQSNAMRMRPIRPNEMARCMSDVLVRLKQQAPLSDGSIALAPWHVSRPAHFGTRWRS
jgi:hypothetical protein